MSADIHPLPEPLSVAYPDWIAPRIESHGLQRHLHDIAETGYTVLENAASPELTERVRNAIIRCSDETVGGGKGRTAALLLGRDPVFDEAVLLRCQCHGRSGTPF